MKNGTISIIISVFLNTLWFRHLNIDKSLIESCLQMRRRNN